jgi:hypothetical protein
MVVLDSLRDCFSWRQTKKPYAARAAPASKASIMHMEILPSRQTNLNENWSAWNGGPVIADSAPEVGRRGLRGGQDNRISEGRSESMGSTLQSAYKQVSHRERTTRRRVHSNPINRFYIRAVLIVDSFEQDRNAYLVLEHIDGAQRRAILFFCRCAPSCHCGPGFQPGQKTPTIRLQFGRHPRNPWARGQASKGGQLGSAPAGCP